MSSFCTTESRPDFAYLGWNPLEIRLGRSLYAPGLAEPVHLPFQARGIRNCSYASERGYVGVSVEDHSHGGQVVAVYERRSGETREVVREEYLLHHALDRGGTKLCYTRPSERQGAADLLIVDLDGTSSSGAAAEVLSSALAQGTVPSWLPDARHIVYHTADGQLEIVDSRDGDRREMAEEGEYPAASPDGERIAFRRGEELWLWSRRCGARRVEVRTGVLPRSLTGVPSWSPGGDKLAVGTVGGWVGKRTDFFLVDLESGRTWKTRTRYLSGLLLLDDGKGEP